MTQRATTQVCLTPILLLQLEIPSIQICTTRKHRKVLHCGNILSLVCLLCTMLCVVVQVSQRKKMLRRVRSTVVLAPRLFRTMVSCLFRLFCMFCLFRTLAAHLFRTLVARLFHLFRTHWLHVCVVHWLHACSACFVHWLNKPKSWVKRYVARCASNVTPLHVNGEKVFLCYSYLNPLKFKEKPHIKCFLLLSV